VTGYQSYNFGTPKFLTLVAPVHMHNVPCVIAGPGWSLGNHTSLCIHSYPEEKEKAPVYFLRKFDVTTNFTAINFNFLFGNSQTL